MYRADPSSWPYWPCRRGKRHRFRSQQFWAQFQSPLFLGESPNQRRAVTPDNKTLIIASAKCNNAEEFKPFAVILNPKTMSYEVDESVTKEDMEAWLEEMGADSGVKKKQKMAPEQIKAAIINLVPETGTRPKYEVLAAATATRISRDDVRDYIKILLREKRLFAHNALRRIKSLVLWMLAAIAEEPGSDLPLPMCLRFQVATETTKLTLLGCRLTVRSEGVLSD